MKAWKSITIIVAAYLFCFSAGPTTAQDKDTTKQEKSRTYTFAKDIAPIIEKYCMSCHGSDNENPSDLYMDDFATLMKGGKHGVPVVPGSPEKSLMYQKLEPDPPFGKQMPRGRKKITPEAVKVIHDWIEQGAKEK